VCELPEWSNPVRSAQWVRDGGMRVFAEEFVLSGFDDARDLTVLGAERIRLPSGFSSPTVCVLMPRTIATRGAPSSIVGVHNRGPSRASYPPLASSPAKCW